MMRMRQSEMEGHRQQPSAASRPPPPPPPPRRAVVVNPYLSRRMSSAPTTASTSTTPANTPSHAASPLAKIKTTTTTTTTTTSSKKRTRKETDATTSTAAYTTMMTKPHPAIPTRPSSSSVTPTPKKGRIGNHDGSSLVAFGGAMSSRIAAAASSSAASGEDDVAAIVERGASDAGGNIRHHPAEAVTRANPVPNPRGTSLRTRLKSQIAELQRKKRLFLQRKVDDERRAMIQKEREDRRMKREEETRRMALMMESIRIEEDRKRRREEVERCINDLYVVVERRISYENDNPGVHYSVGEAMECAIRTVEMRASNEEVEEVRRRTAARRSLAELRRLERSARMMEGAHDIRRRMYEVGTCLHDIVNAVVAGATMANATNNSNATTTAMMHHAVHNPMTTCGGYRRPRQYTTTAIPSSASIAPLITTGAYVRGEGPVIDNMQYASSYHVRPASAAAGHPWAAYRHPMYGGPLPHHPPGVVHRMLTQYPTSSSLSSPMMVHAVPAKAQTLASTTLHPRPILDPYSPYSITHRALSMEIRITKKNAGERFGVSLRYECRSALVPREFDSIVAPGDGVAPPTVSSHPASSSFATTKTRKPRRKRVSYGVVAVVDASAAAYATAGNRLRPGDVILSINGIPVGEGSMSTFSDAARAISDSSPACPNTGVVLCSLTVARATGSGGCPVVVSRGPPPAVVPGPIILPTHVPPPASPLIPFRALGDGTTISGEFTTVEWRALVRGMTNIPHRLFSGALISVTQQEALVAIQKSDEYGGSLRKRGLEALEAKLAHESKHVASEMRRKAERHWTIEWKEESKKYANLPDGGDDAPKLMDSLTDAQRSFLRLAARPVHGCRCGSLSHDYVSDPSCPLYRDVRRFCDDNSIDIKVATNRVSVDATRKDLKTTTMKIKNVLEKAYVDRFVKLRAENSATREEAEFVLEMETIQSSMMKKAVLAPPSLCTLILSAVASMMDKLEEGTKPEPRSTSSKRPSLDSDDSDDDDVPLNTLVQSSAKRMAPNANSLPLKRAKSSDSNINGKWAPHPYCMAEILNHVSLCHGHLFEEPAHADFAWQQRHRSTLTTPLPKEVMFKGNPRTPGTLSFENIRFILDDELMTRLRQSWERSAHNLDDDATEINDEWIVSHLSSDTMTGVRHEIDVMSSLGILTIKASGALVLSENWHERVPHMILNEVKYAWGSKVDVNNLFCVHNKIKATLESYWKQDEYGWRIASHVVDDDDDDAELVFDDEEYQLREQIFRENYSNWVSASLGMGEFGV
ncbi:hypothetical protein ACHAXA_005252 [Cyclostephanos tholiformis]|uniref:PDZ domain-containing protein n=1 Tax=Cyclostephanos tholiformis TaxID=382380 RepID=A0ABD3R5K6_9STRA